MTGPLHRLHSACRRGRVRGATPRTRGQGPDGGTERSSSRRSGERSAGSFLPSPCDALLESAA